MKRRWITRFPPRWRKGKAEHDAGAFAQALYDHEAALDARAAVLGDGHSLVAVSLTHCAFALDKLRRRDEAAAAAGHALAIRTKALGPAHPALGRAAKLHAALLGAAGRHAESAAAYRAAAASYVRRGDAWKARRNLARARARAVAAALAPRRRAGARRGG